MEAGCFYSFILEFMFSRFGGALVGNTASLLENLFY